MFLASFLVLVINQATYIILYAAQHRAAVRKTPQSRPIHSGMGMELEKAKAMQAKIEDFVKHMSELLRIERDSELEFTQEELNAVPMPNGKQDTPKPTEYLVSHGQAQQEQCDTLCNLNAISSSIGKLKFYLFYLHRLGKQPST